MMSRGRSVEDPAEASIRAAALVKLFCPEVAFFGMISGISPEDLTADDRRLLDHRSHMTVAMEKHHGCRVGVKVLAVRDAEPGTGERYAREIVLVRPDGRIVQYGIVRIELESVDPAVRAAIRRGDEPLGRILVNAGLLCDVQHVQLVRIEPGPHVRRLIQSSEPLSGRVAEILVGGRPAIELLEVVVPA